MKNSCNKDLYFEVVSKNPFIPDYIFKNRFNFHYFFDVGLSECEEFGSDIQDILKTLGYQQRGVVYSSETGELISTLTESTDWGRFLVDSIEERRKNGEFGESCIIDEEKNWVIFQLRPVDLGVFAFNSNNAQTPCKPLEDWFFTDKSIRKWLLDEKNNDSSPCRPYGASFFEAILNNYYA